MIRFPGQANTSGDPKLSQPLPPVAAVAMPHEAKIAVAQKAAAETVARPVKSNRQSNAPKSNAATFDKKAYQRDLMRKRRAAAKQKAKA